MIWSLPNYGLGATICKLDRGHKIQEMKRQFIYLLVLRAKQLISNKLISTGRNEGRITIFSKKTVPSVEKCFSECNCRKIKENSSCPASGISAFSFKYNVEKSQRTTGKKKKKAIAFGNCWKAVSRSAALQWNADNVTRCFLPAGIRRQLGKPTVSKHN